MEVIDKRGSEKPPRQDPAPPKSTPLKEVWCPVCRKRPGVLVTSILPEQFLVCRKCGVVFLHPDALIEVNKQLNDMPTADGGNVNGKG